MNTPQRNDPCPCGSGKKYKKCCLGKITPAMTGTPHNIVPDINKAFNHAVSLRNAGYLTEAAAACHEILAHQSAHFETLQMLGEIEYQCGRPEHALLWFDKALKADSRSSFAHYNRGLILQALKRFEEAMASYNRALALDAGFAKAYNNRGNVLNELGRLEAALQNYDRAIAVKPDYAVAYNNRGNVLKEQGQWEAALQSYDHAIALQPDYAGACYNKGFLKLLLGDFEAGWPLYEWRWKIDQKDIVRNFKQPLWLGDESVADKSILLYPEQGLGDVIQFVRYVPMVEALGAKVILEVPGPLVSLIKTLKGTFRVVEKGESLPAFDLHCPIMSLPLAFRTTIETIPAEVPYLGVSPQKRVELQTQLGPKIRRRIGLAWSGFAGHTNDRNRSIALRMLEPLLSLDVEYHSLQKEIRPDDEATLREYTQIQSHKDHISDFADTAALISEMDLVISVDTSVAHLAGALGKPVWILLPYSPDWRWLTERADSPWYPTARLFRQQQPIDWANVVARIYQELIRLTTAAQVECQPG